MPLPRRSTVARSAKKPAKKKAISRAKRGELLLVTCGPAVPGYLVESIARDLEMSVLDRGGRTLQIVETRIDGRKVYGKWRELHEVAPYMFV